MYFFISKLKISLQIVKFPYNDLAKFPSFSHPVKRGAQIALNQKLISLKPNVYLIDRSICLVINMFSNRMIIDMNLHCKISCGICSFKCDILNFCPSTDRGPNVNIVKHKQ